jgi:hypothetical protein
MCFLDNHSCRLVGSIWAKKILLLFLGTGLQDDESSHVTNLDLSPAACDHWMGGVGPRYDSQCPLVSAAANQSRPR